MKRTPKLEIYKASDGYRWRLKAANSRIIAESGEGYKRRPGPELILTIRAAFLNAEIVVVP